MTTDGAIPPASDGGGAGVGDRFPTSGTAHLTLEPESSSAAVARRWVVERLSHFREDASDDVALLVTEVVTNAIIHAKTSIDVGVSIVAGAARVEVVDRSPVFPTAKNYTVNAATGRGLTLLDALATTWGAEILPGGPVGKVVWFEVADGDRDHAPVVPDFFDLDAFAEVDDLEATTSTAELVSVHLFGVPIRLLSEVSEQYDALFREFRLLAERSSNAPELPGRLITLVDDLTGRYRSFTTGTSAELDAAKASQRSSIDLEFRLPPEAGPATARYNDLLDEADRYCAAGSLLTLAPSPEAVALRKWLLGEFVRQVAGGTPVAWADSEWSRTSPPSLESMIGEQP
ncbi:MAG: hypothetical protein NVS3B12_11210 [Acidimicrobiales bacterium]